MQKGSEMSISRIGYGNHLYGLQNQSQNPVVQQLEEKINCLMQEVRALNSSNARTAQNDLELMIFCRDQLVEKEKLLKAIKELDDKYSELSEVELSDKNCGKIIIIAFFVGMVGPATANFLDLPPKGRDLFKGVSSFITNHTFDIEKLTNIFSDTKSVETFSQSKAFTDESSIALVRLEQLKVKIIELELSLVKDDSYWSKPSDFELETLKRDLDLMISVRDEIFEKAKAFKRMRELEEKISDLGLHILNAKSKCETQAKIAQFGGGVIGNFVQPFSPANLNRPGIF